MTNKALYKCLIAVLLVSFGFTAMAAESSPVGVWTTIDKTKKPRAIVKLWKYKDELFGKILKVFPRPGDTGRCVQCPGEYRNKPIKGLTFIWNLRQDKANPNHWYGGRILDPKNGKVYRCKMTLIDHGKRLKVRGYIGLSLLGRTQIWERGIAKKTKSQ